MSSELEIRPAQQEEIPLLLQFIRELAEYEKLSVDVCATKDQLHKTLFGPQPYARALLGFANGEAAGFAVYFFAYSTFMARPTLYVEDVFVREAWRRRGLGRELFREMFRIAQRENCGRIEWSVLDWNAPSIAFYEKLGAKAKREWLKYSLPIDETGKELLA